MRPAIPRALIVVVACLAAFGCSTSEEKLLGAARLLRGPGGVGNTTQIVLTPDRDTYVGTDKAFFTPTLLVGAEGSLEARAFYSTSAWSVPAVPQDSVTRIEVVLPVAAAADRPTGMVVGISLATSAFDSSAAWPGPLPGASFAIFPTDSLGPLTFQYPVSSFADLQGWAAAPATFPGFVVVNLGPNRVLALDANSALVRVIHRPVGTPGVIDSMETFLTRHFSLRTSLSPAPAGTETALVLGGTYDTGCLVRFPPFSVPEGSTVNEATLRLRLDPGTIPFATGDSVRIDAYRVRTAWSEADVSRDALTIDATPIGARGDVRVAATDSVITLPLPSTIIREWGAAGGVNEGVLLLLKAPYFTPPVLLRGRESAAPIELRVSFTSPPPPRF